MISVIVPVYNSERWLRRCVDSILAQTYTDFELLLIDDGSTDNSGVICDEYASLDSRVSIFHKPNGGVSSARNLGLDKANGEWVTFIDADDWIEFNMFENYLKYAHSKINLLFGGHNNYFADGRVETKHLPSVCIDKSNFDSYYSKYEFQWRTSPWAKFYKKSTIDSLGLRFDSKMKIGEDAIFLYRFMIYEGVFRLVPVYGYNYNFEVSSSLTKKTYEYNQEIYFYDNIKAVVKDLNDAFAFKSLETVSNLDKLLGYYTNRILNSLYITSELSQRKRINIIKHLDICLLINSFYARGIKEQFLYMLLKMRMYTLYDILRKMKKVIYDI